MPIHNDESLVARMERDGLNPGDVLGGGYAHTDKDQPKVEEQSGRTFKAEKQLRIKHLVHFLEEIS